jgi:uncharacterized protein YecA (UPF0149 family)
MNCNTGEIYPPELFAELQKLWTKEEKKTDVPSPQRQEFIPMEVEPTTEQLKRKPPKVGRNDICPCGSGKKFKHCHLILNFRLTDSRRVK